MKFRSALCVLTLLSAIPGSADTCPTKITNFLDNKTAGALTCFHEADLRTTVPPSAPVTPPDNSITTYADGVTPLPGLFAGFGSITPVTDLGVISNGPAIVPTPSNGPMPGWEVYG